MSECKREGWRERERGREGGRVCVVFSCFQLLEEMLDNGYPLATESNVLKELIKPPSMVRSMVHTITGESKLAK